MENLSFPAGEPLSLLTLLMNLAVGAVLAMFLRWHFVRFGSTLSNRDEFAMVFPFILLTTVLIITVVKSSLALSLGLVGALSIVRFRTPIKEPEELAYLFIAIAIGLGLGANQTLITIVSAATILGFMVFFSKNYENSVSKNLYLSIDCQDGDDSAVDDVMGRLEGVMAEHMASRDLRRYDMRNGSLEVTYFVDVANTEQLSTLTTNIRKVLPNAGVTFLDQNQIPSI